MKLKKLLVIIFLFTTSCLNNSPNHETLPNNSLNNAQITSICFETFRNNLQKVSAISFSESGERLAFIYTNGVNLNKISSNLYFINKDGTNLKLIHKIEDFELSYDHSQYDIDKISIYYQTYWKEKDKYIYLIDPKKIIKYSIDENKEQKFNNELTYYYYLSPDGKFLLGNKIGQSDFLLIDLSNSKTNPLEIQNGFYESSIIYLTFNWIQNSNNLIYLTILERDFESGWFYAFGEIDENKTEVNNLKIFKKLENRLDALQILGYYDGNIFYMDKKNDLYKYNIENENETKIRENIINKDNNAFSHDYTQRVYTENNKFWLENVIEGNKKELLNITEKLPKGEIVSANECAY